MAKESYAYQRAYDWMILKIESGEWPDGCQIPPETDLALQFDLSRDTVRKALLMLRRAGYISRRAGKGTFVLGKKSDYRLFQLESFSEQMRARGKVPSSKIFSLRPILPDHGVRKRLQLQKNELAYEVLRLRLADGEPMAYEKLYIPAKLVPDLEENVTEHTSFYELYENTYGLKIGYGDLRLEAQICPDDVAEILQNAKGSPVLKMSCVIYQDDRQPLYTLRCYYSFDKYYFSLSAPRHNF